MIKFSDINLLYTLSIIFFKEIYKIFSLSLYKNYDDITNQILLLLIIYIDNYFIKSNFFFIFHLNLLK